LRRVAAWSAAGFATESLAYWMVLVWFGAPLLEWLYGGTYRYRSGVIVMLGLVPLLNGLMNVLGSALRAREQPDAVFWATVASVIVASTIGVGAVALHGVAGAVFGLVCASATQAVMMLCLLMRNERSI
jgi:O-antigen/teichoic acid export membrane protein